MIEALVDLFAEDRNRRSKGEKPQMCKVISEEVAYLAVFKNEDAIKFF